MQNIGDIIKKKSFTPDHRNKHEFQAYGNRLADELGDQRHRALYIKLAKNENRGLLEAAKSYVIDADRVPEKGRLFMWKLTQLKKEAAARAEKKDELNKSSN